VRRSLIVAASKAVSLAGFFWASCGSAFSAELAAKAAEEPPELVAAEPGEEAITNARPVAHVARISASEAPTIDADLSDPGWAKATVITDFKQREPDPGAPPTERTVLRIMYDDNNFYLSVYAYDSEPDRLIVRSMSRDGEVNQGDHIEITLDPGLTLRNAYAFRIGPAGGRWDGLRLNNLQELPEWNAIWEARARRVPDGWVAEIAIPFRSISYVPGQTNWGFDFTRNIRRKTEIVRWSSINPGIPIADVSEAGTLTGIQDVNQGLGLDVVPYIALRAKHNWSVPGDGAGLSATAGGNAFYKITPGLTGTVTVNPDFSDAPLDVREVNTTRFSLFYPETRQFFLQDAGAFEFGGRSFRRSNTDRQNTNALPFFTRNIGLVNGRPVSLVGGGKLSGEYGGIGIGALSVLTDRTPTGRPGQVLSVARMTLPAFSMSRGGIIFTNGDPTGQSRNSVAGADFQYLDDTTFGGNVFQADAYYERSFSNKAGQDDSYSLGFNYPNEPFSAEFYFKTVGENFTPALGFVNRPGIRAYDGTLRYLWRYRGPGNFLRTIALDTSHSVTTNISGRIDTRDEALQVQVTTASDHSVYATVRNNFDRLVKPFVLPHNVIIPAGSYTWNNFNTHTQISRSQPLSLHVDVICCDYYNGNMVRVSPDLRFRPSEYLEMNLSYDGQFIRLPGGKVDINVLTMDGLINFTPDMQFAIQAQYDNISQSFGFLGRYRWEFRPGSEILIAAGQSALVPGTDFRFQTTALSVRIGHTLRF
jgi:hypothetical protein